MIDNGDISNTIGYKSISPYYFNNPLRYYDKNSKVIIRNEDERYKNEIY